MKYLGIVVAVVAALTVAIVAYSADVDVSSAKIGGAGDFVRHVYTNRSTTVTVGNADTFKISGWTAWTATIAGEGTLANYSGDVTVQGSVNKTDWVTIGTKTGDTGTQVQSSTFGAPYRYLRFGYTPDGVTGDITTIDLDLYLVK